MLFLDHVPFIPLLIKLVFNVHVSLVTFQNIMFLKTCDNDVILYNLRFKDGLLHLIKMKKIHTIYLRTNLLTLPCSLTVVLPTPLCLPTAIWRRSPETVVQHQSVNGRLSRVVSLVQELSVDMV